MLHIVDDEEVIRDSLSWLAYSRSIPAAGYGSADAFLRALEADDPFDPAGDCLLLDVRMPDMSGTLLFDTLSERGFTRRVPVIFLTGHGDVPMAVDSLKRGAFDFFEKPFNDNKLMDRVQEALQASREAGDRAQVDRRLATLSAREREVLEGRHVPIVGANSSLTSVISSRLSSPARWRPQNRRQSVQAPIFSPRQLPALIGPVTRRMAGTLALAAPMSSAGTVLSQPPSRITASIGWARIISSTSSAIRLRRYMLVGWEKLSCSEMTGKAMGMPPASMTPRLAASIRSGTLRWQAL